ncbi:MAG: serine protease [Suilimivivens sp.]
MKKYLSVLSLIFLLIFIVLQGEQQKITPVLKNENLEKAYENVLCSAVRVQGSSHYGSGSILEMAGDEVIVVTNRHVVQYFDEQSYVTFFNGLQGQGEVLGYSATADVGYIRVSLRGAPKSKKNQLKAVSRRQKAYDDLKENACFFMIDIASDLTSPVLYKGAVVDKARFLEEYGTEMLYGDGAAVPGMSGSGIFDYCGNFIGMLSGATQQYELAGVPLKVILEEYEKCSKN